MNFIDVFKREFKTIFSDMAIVLTIFAGVFIYSFLYPQPYLNQSVTSLPISVVDLDKSDVSREILFKIQSTPQINIVRMDLSMKNAQRAVLSDEVKAILVIPKHFKRDIALHKSPTISLGADSSYFLVYGAIVEGVVKSVLTQSATLKIVTQLKNGVPMSGAKNNYIPYSLDIINLYNTQNSYTQYVIPAVFILILQQTMLIGLGILGGGVNERQEKRGNTWMVMLSRVIIFGTIFFINMLFYFGFSFEFFDVQHLGSIYDLVLFGIPFILASVFFGIFLGSLFTSRDIATPAILFTSLPLVFSAGFIWPLEAVPTFIKILSNFVPSTPAINGFLKINQMGAEFSMVSEQYIILWIQVFVYMILAYSIIEKKRQKYCNE